jgi:hypothetical protein
MIVVRHCAKPELILGAKRASPTLLAALAICRAYRLPAGNNDDLPIAERL